MSSLHPSWSGVCRPVIGMLHLLPLPGSPRYQAGVDAIRDRLMRDAEALVSGGVDGLMIENFGDVPFYPDRVPAHVVAQMTALACELRKRFDRVPLGINVLRNDGRSALAVAHAIAADFIRVNVLCGARVTDQGIIQGIAHQLLRDRAMLGASSIRILADVDVKHSAPLAPRAIEDEVQDTIERGLADALIVSGAGTGKPTDPSQAARVKAAAKATPVLVGSGVSLNNVSDLWEHCDGFIVGTWFKREGIASNPVDADRVRQFMRAVKSSRALSLQSPAAGGCRASSAS
ncbi:BtpA/SgcQ family protein [Fontivita pretiosa]|uniref:BtpA/SgcQ family protein n=1 Tax=Fontivita pretiosa TaxID=2989684 RepID=UPI003D16DA1C